MNLRKSVIVVLSLAVFLFSLMPLLYERSFRESDKEEEGHALEAFEYWYNQRALPGDLIPPGAFLRASNYIKNSMKKERALDGNMADTTTWTSIGPDNIGGRVLAIAVHPTHPETVWAGAASGGLWRSVTAGRGANAWTRINTDYPTIAVSSIAIYSLDPRLMFIGTGEIGAGYKFRQIGTPGARTTYGMGVLKSTDEGTTWSLTGLVYEFPQVTAIQKVIINPKNPNTVYAATSEGTFKSIDGGTTWSLSHPVLMAMDLVLNPIDTTVLYVACGQRNTTSDPGLYKTTDAGATWNLLSGGLPTSNFGRTTLAISPVNPAIVYAGISNASTLRMLGLYRTTNSGSTWSLRSSTNYVSSQGWYDNVVAVHPIGPDTVFCSGLDVYKSTQGGSNLVQKSFWYLGYGYEIPAGGYEGPPNYTHADHHAMTFHPTDPNIMYIGCDGGVFASTDGGESFEGRNGGFITTQFYNGFANAVTDSFTALGGLQDNGTVKYQGTKSWSKVFGGDGGWCAIDPTNKDIIYEEYVYLTLSKSTDGGYSWFSLSNGLTAGAGSANFIAPFAIAPSNPNVVYAGGLTAFKTSDGGSFWDPTTGSQDLNGTALSCIGISYQSAETVIVGTGGFTTHPTPSFQIFNTTDGGELWNNVSSSLPNRYPTDVAFYPHSGGLAYLTYSGYGGPHVFKTTDAGFTWNDISSNLPDIPTQSVDVDPENPDIIFVGTDLGVFRTLDGGASWHEYNTGMPDAMVTDLGISVSNRTLRAATFGNGVYERPLPPPSPVTTSVASGWNLVSVPVTPSDTRDSAIFPNSNSFSYAYEGSYQRKINLANGIGYWKKFPAAEPIAFAGIRIHKDTIAVTKGWNLVGSISDPLPVNIIGIVPTGILGSNFYEYNNGYFVASTIMPGKAYWVKVNEDGLLIFNSGGSQTIAEHPMSNVPVNVNVLTIADADHHQQQLYVNTNRSVEVNKLDYEMPPLPPAGAFDARFSSGYLVEDTREGIIKHCDLAISSARYPLTVQWNGQEGTGQFVVDGKFFDLTNSNNIVIARPPSRVSIRFTVNDSQNQPQQCSLEQNYPNPFNPQTTIQYTVGTDATSGNDVQVSLIVYDMLGRQVATLVNERQQPGIHAVQWNAAETPSGLYMVKLNAGNFESTRKMVVVK